MSDPKIMENCYVCKKKIGNKPKYDVGKNLEGVKISRHLNCSPLKLSREELNKVKNSKIPI